MFARLKILPDPCKRGLNLEGFFFHYFNDFCSFSLGFVLCGIFFVIRRLTSLSIFVASSLYIISAYHLHGNFGGKFPSNGTGFLGGAGGGAPKTGTGLSFRHLQNTGKVFAFS